MVSMMNLWDPVERLAGALERRTHHPQTREKTG